MTILNPIKLPTHVHSHDSAMASLRVVGAVILTLALIAIGLWPVLVDLGIIRWS